MNVPCAPKVVQIDIGRLPVEWESLQPGAIERFLDDMENSQREQDKELLKKMGEMTDKNNTCKE